MALCFNGDTPCRDFAPSQADADRVYVKQSKKPLAQTRPKVFFGFFNLKGPPHNFFLSNYKHSFNHIYTKNVSELVPASL